MRETLSAAEPKEAPGWVGRWEEREEEMEGEKEGETEGEREIEREMEGEMERERERERERDDGVRAHHFPCDFRFVRLPAAPLTNSLAKTTAQRSDSIFYGR